MNHKQAEDRVVRYHSGECAFPIKPIFFCRLILSYRKEQCQDKIEILPQICYIVFVTCRQDSDKTGFDYRLKTVLPVSVFIITE